MPKLRQIHWNSDRDSARGYCWPSGEGRFNICGVHTSAEDAKRLRDHLTESIEEMERRNAQGR